MFEHPMTNVSAVDNSSLLVSPGSTHFSHGPALSRTLQSACKCEAISFENEDFFSFSASTSQQRLDPHSWKREPPETSGQIPTDYDLNAFRERPETGELRKTTLSSRSTSEELKNVRRPISSTLRVPLELNHMAPPSSSGTRWKSRPPNIHAMPVANSRIKNWIILCGQLSWDSSKAPATRFLCERERQWRWRRTYRDRETEGNR